MISLPWLTQMDGVVLEDRGTGKLPSLETEFRVVHMSFSPAGKTHGGHYDLYIDPQTNRLFGSHLIIDASFGDAIDVSMLEPPEDAEVVYQVER